MHVQVFGLIVAIALRSPDNAEAAVEAGCLQAVVTVSRHSCRSCCQLLLAEHLGIPLAAPHVMSGCIRLRPAAECLTPLMSRLQAMGDHADNAKSAAVQRQGCMAVRNICARCPDLRPVSAPHYDCITGSTRMHCRDPCRIYLR